MDSITDCCEGLEVSDHARGAPRPVDGRHELRADCGRCAGLCCVASAFTVSADFAADKPAGQPCHHLRADFGCGIHDGLRERGFPGCAVFDCFGAGQQVTQVTFGGRDWRTAPEAATSMFAVFTVMRQLHEVLWHLHEAEVLVPSGRLHDEIAHTRQRTETLTAAGPDTLARFDVGTIRRDVGTLLEKVSDVVRSEIRDRAPDRRGADMVGAALHGVDLHGASLRGAYLIGADLRGANLRRADLLGTDLRSADLRGADLTGSIFVTQPQLEAATGDAGTAIPPALVRPAHWHPAVSAATTCG